MPKKRGRPPGKKVPGIPTEAPALRRKVSEIVEAMFADHIEPILAATVSRAMQGEYGAVKIILDRISPPRKGRLVNFALPPIKTLSDIAEAQLRLLQALADGEVTTAEAQEISDVMDATGAAIERRELETRIKMLELKHGS